MTELVLLRVLVFVSGAAAPLGTHRYFLPARSPLQVAAYGAALACAAVGLFTPVAIASVGWLLFCAGSFALFLRARTRALGLSAALRSHRVLAACVPFLFSNIAAVWFIAGTNDLALLGYDPAFSFYAALHGNVLGWMVVGALAILAHEDDADRRFLAAVLVCFVSFLLVAFGIDQLRALKSVGLLGLTVALLPSQLVFVRRVWRRNHAAFILGAVSLAGLLVTMALAWANHCATPLLPPLAGVRAMVSAHGLINAVVVGPCFLAAVLLDARSFGHRSPGGADPPSPAA